MMCVELNRRIFLFAVGTSVIAGTLATRRRSNTAGTTPRPDGLYFFSETCPASPGRACTAAIHYLPSSDTTVS
jgi:hypothetical protein